MRSWLFLLEVFFLSGVVFASVGVSPSSYDIDFEPGLSREISFDFYFEPGQVAELYKEGYLSEFVELNKKTIYGKERVVAKISLPEKIEVPGEHLIFIGARQKDLGGKGISVAADIRAIIRIRVPYPNKYIEPKLFAYDIDKGDILNISVFLVNKGNENASALSTIQIFNEDGEIIDRFELEKFFLMPTQSVLIYKLVNSSNYEPGNYSASVSVDYGVGVLSRADQFFRVGNIGVEILNYTKKVSYGGIRPFFVEVESKSSKKIKNVFVEARPVGFEFLSFKTPIKDIEPFKRVVMQGYFDASFDLGDRVFLNLTVNFGNFSESKLVALEIERKPFFIGYAILFIFFLLFLFLIIKFVIYLKKKILK